MQEITEESENETFSNGRHFFAIKNDKGMYQSYNRGYDFTPYVNNAKLWGRKSVINEGQRLLKFKKEYPNRCKWEKIFFVEIAYSEVDSD